MLGLQLRPDDTSDGEHAAPADVKSNRWLVEASIALGSPLIGTPLDDARASFLNGAQVWAIRQRKEVADWRAQVFGRRQRTSLSSRRASSSSARKGSLGSAIELHALLQAMNLNRRASILWTHISEAAPTFSTCFKASLNRSMRVKCPNASMRGNASKQV